MTLEERIEAMALAMGIDWHDIPFARTAQQRGAIVAASLREFLADGVLFGCEPAGRDEWDSEFYEMFVVARNGLQDELEALEFALSMAAE